MFPSESALVEKLVCDLQQKYGIQYIVRELRSGNNIADIAYTENIERDNIVFDDYLNAYYYFRSVYNKKKVNVQEFGISSSTATKKFYRFLHELADLGYVEIDGTYVKTIKKVDAVTKNFIAVEAKLSDWRGGLEQALRYTQFANEVYVALSDEYIIKVNKDLFRENGVGLMSVSNGVLKIPVKAKKLKVEKLDIQYYIIDRFLKQLKGENIPEST